MNSLALAFAVVTVILNGTAQLLLRQAAMSGAVPTSPLTLVKNAWFVCGLAAYGVSVLTWLLVLRRVPLSVAAPFVALVYVIVPLASRLFFDDPVTVRMWLGMALVRPDDESPDDAFTHVAVHLRVHRSRRSARNAAHDVQWFKCLPARVMPVVGEKHDRAPRKPAKPVEQGVER